MFDDRDGLQVKNNKTGRITHIPPGLTIALAILILLLPWLTGLYTIGLAFMYRFGN